MKNMTRPFNQTKGFSLVEVLITVLVLSIGMLGIAGMQTTSLRLSSEAHLRSQATEIAYDLFARIRANPAADYTVANPGNGNCIDQECTPDQIRDFDLTFWNNQLVNQFPNGVATITSNDVDNVTYIQLTINWYERVEGLTERSTNRNRAIDIEPRAFTITARI